MNAWSELGRAAQILDNLIAEGKAKPMIVVMPNGNPNCQAAPGEWSWGMYTPGFRDAGTGPTAPAAATIPESFMDIVNYVDANYRTIKDRAHRAICGLSMGGGHTFHVSLLYPNKFDYFGLFSAGLHLDNGAFDASFAEQIKTNSTGWVWVIPTSSIRAQSICVLSGTAKVTSMNMWRPMAVTSGATGASI